MRSDLLCEEFGEFGESVRDVLLDAFPDDCEAMILSSLISSASPHLQLRKS